MVDLKIRQFVGNREASLLGMSNVLEPKFI